MNPQIEAFPLFKGAARLPLYFGVPVYALISMLMVVVPLGALISFWLFLLAIPLLVVMQFIVRKDMGAFRKIWLYLNTTFMNKDKAFWRASSYSPVSYKPAKWRLWEYNDDKFSRLSSQKSVSKYVPYSYHVTEDVVVTREGNYVSTFKIGGCFHESLSDIELKRRVEHLNQLIINVSSEQVAFWSHLIRRKVSEFPEGDFENSFCDNLNKRYRERFESAGLMVNELYLTVVYQPIGDQVLKGLSGGKGSVDDKRHYQLDALSTLSEINRLILNAFKGYEIELLGMERRSKHAYSKALEFFGTLINGEKLAMPVCKERFYEYMASSRPLFSQYGEMGELRTLKSTRHFGMLEIWDYDEGTEAGNFNNLFKAPYEFVLTQSFVPVSRQNAEKFLKRHKKHLSDSRDAGEEQINQLEVALNDLICGRYVMGHHHATMLVYGESANTVVDYLSMARATFLEAATIVQPCDMALEAGFWSQMPGVFKYRPRPKPITSLNFLSFSSFHNFMTGKPKGNPWGDAVCILKTESKSPFYFNFHPSPRNKNVLGHRMPGNTAIIGRTGAGKTVLLGFLLAQSQKFKPRVVVFDKDRGMDVAIRAMGGRYLPIKRGEPSGFNPFQMEPEHSNLDFLRKLVIKLVSNDIPVNHKDEEEISRSIDTLMSSISKDQRRLSTLLQLLPNPIGEDDRPSVHGRLKKWCQGGALGWLFDNKEDLLDFNQGRIFGFDVTEFLDDAEVRTPIAMYILHRSEQSIDGKPFMYIGDELWKLVSDPHFEPHFKNKQKTNRKENGIFVFATQEPEDVLRSPIASTLISQCATQIFLPDPSCERAHYVDGFKLTEWEFQRIKKLSVDSRTFLVKQNEHSTMAILDLEGLSDELAVLSGTPDRARMLEEMVKEQELKGVDQWLPLYIKQIQEEAVHGA